VKLHFNYFIVKGGAICFFWSHTHNSISLRYTRNIVQLNSFYIKFDSKHFVYLYKRSQITSNYYVSNWKSSYDVDNEMARNIARVKLKTIISLWNYRFYLTRKIRKVIGHVYIMCVVSIDFASFYIYIMFYYIDSCELQNFPS
jgi:hypothetical protein